MTGHGKELMVISLFVGVVAIVGSLIVVTSHGAVGVAFVMAISTIIQQLSMLFVIRLRCGIWTYASPSLAIKHGRSLFLDVMAARRVNK